MLPGLNDNRTCKETATKPISATDIATLTLETGRNQGQNQLEWEKMSTNFVQLLPQHFFNIRTPPLFLVFL